MLPAALPEYPPPRTPLLSPDAHAQGAASPAKKDGAPAKKDGAKARAIEQAAYATPEFGVALERQIALLDRLAARADAEERARMARWFHRSLRYEWMFWDQADRRLA